MMDVKDVRKGNWLLLKEHKKGGSALQSYVQVNDVEENKVNGLESTLYDPLPVTVDILRQLGFSNEKEDDELEMTFLKFTVDENPNYKFRAKKIPGSDHYQLSLFLGDHQLWPWLSAVHEIQNYYFVQNGQEIEFTF